MSGEFPNPEIDDLQPVKLVARKEKLTRNPTDILVIRPPLHYSPNEIDTIVDNFSIRGILPILLEQTPDENVDRYYPTDMYREVGSRIFGESDKIAAVLSSCEGIITPSQKSDIESRVYEPPGNGGAYVYDTHSKKMVFEDHLEMREMMVYLRPEGWDFFPTNIENLRLIDGFITDIDFLFFPFTGKDGRLHALVAEEYRYKAPGVFIPHIIPSEEVVKGGCNIGDVRGGGTLLLPHRVDAPTTVTVLENLSRADLVQTPPGFIEGHGGPRCSTSSISLR